jgi:hypothetical protein
MEVSGQLHAPTALTPGKESPVPRADLDAVAKRKNPIIAPAGNWTLVVQPVA